MKIFRKSQIAMEFLIIITLVLAVFVGFIYIINEQITSIGVNEDRVAMQNLGNAIKNEVLIARGVHANYIRYFEIPEQLNGKNYSVRLIDSENVWKDALEINVKGEVRYFTLPVDIKGQFVEVSSDFLDYCITKGKSDISISRNQVSIEYACYAGNCDSDIELGVDNILEVSDGEEFSLYLTANCVNNLQTASFDVIHPGFNYLRKVKAWDHSIPGINPSNIYGDFMFDGSIKKAFSDVTSCGANCSRVTISHAGYDGPTGSDALIELVFNAVGNPNLYTFRIGDVDLVDAKIDRIPPSKQGVKVLIK